MDIHGYPWIQWMSMNAHGFHEYQCTSMDVDGFYEFRGYPWNPLVSVESMGVVLIQFAGSLRGGIPS
jgi:hypothetical protein